YAPPWRPAAGDAARRVASPAVASSVLMLCEVGALIVVGRGGAGIIVQITRHRPIPRRGEIPAAAFGAKRSRPRGRLRQAPLGWSCQHRESICVSQLSAKAAAFDGWIRTVFVELNTSLENLYFAQPNRAAVLGVGDPLKARLRDEGQVHVVALL